MTIIISHNHEEGTIVRGTERSDAATIKSLRTGWRWARSLGAWTWPQSRDKLANRWKIEQLAEAFRAAGRDVEVDIDDTPRDAAVAHADLVERADARAGALAAKAERQHAESDELSKRAHDLSELVPFGQPILVGHHSEKGHRSHLRELHAVSDRAVSTWREAQDTERRAEAVTDHDARLNDPRYVENRIRELVAEERKLTSPERRWRTVDGKETLVSVIPIDVSEQARVRLEFVRSRLAFYREHGAQPKFTRETIKRGDFIRHRFGWAEVVRVNAKSVSVKTQYSWTDTVTYGEIRGHRTAEEVPA